MGSGAPGCPFVPDIKTKLIDIEINKGPIMDLQPAKQNIDGNVKAS